MDLLWKWTPTAGLFFAPDGAGGGDGASDEEPGENDEGTEDTDEEGGGSDDLDALKNENATMRAALAKRNKEAERQRKELEAFQKKEQERADAEKSDLEKANETIAERDERLAALEKKHRTTLIRHSVEMTAAALNFENPGDAHKLADLSDVEVDDETLEVSGVEDILKALAKDKPYLVKKSSKKGDDDLDADRGNGAKASDEALAAKFGLG